MLKVFYNYYFIFYTKILPDNQPHSTVIFTLGFTYALIVNGIINLLLAFLFGFALEKWVMISVFVLIIIGMYFSYYRSGNGK